MQITVFGSFLNGGIKIVENMLRFLVKYIAKRIKNTVKNTVVETHKSNNQKKKFFTAFIEYVLATYRI